MSSRAANSSETAPLPAANSTPVCAITGGTSGVGLATAQRFAAAGYRVAVCGRDAARLAAVETRLPEGHILALAADVGQPAQARKFITEAIRRWERVDVLVHCAAVAPLSPLADMRTTDFDAAIDVNLRGFFHATQAAWEYFLSRGSGADSVIVHVSSLAAIDPFPGFSVYGACKAWGDRMVHALAAEGRPHGIRVYSVRPGAVDTPLLEGLFPDFPKAARLDPGEVAEFIWTICQPPFRYCSGQAINIHRPID